MTRNREPADDVRRKYLEALERKQHKAAAAEQHLGDVKPQGLHTSDKRQRTFRRKSG